MEDRQLEGNLNTDKVFAAKLCEFENSAVVELVRGTETQVVSEFMMAHNRHEQKVITNKGIAETSVQKRKLQNKELNIITDDNYKWSENSDSYVKPDQKKIPKVDEGQLTEVD